jgi:hypothetical protein
LPSLEIRRGRNSPSAHSAPPVNSNSHWKSSQTHYHRRHEAHTLHLVRLPFRSHCPQDAVLTASPAISSPGGPQSRGALSSRNPTPNSPHHCAATSQTTSQSLAPTTSLGQRRQTAASTYLHMSPRPSSSLASPTTSPLSSSTCPMYLPIADVLRQEKQLNWS